jgi:hypothetical protein
VGERTEEEEGKQGRPRVRLAAAGGEFIGDGGRRRASWHRRRSGAGGSATELHRGEEDDGKFAITPLGIFWAALAAAGPACGLRRERRGERRVGLLAWEKRERALLSFFSKTLFLFCFPNSFCILKEILKLQTLCKFQNNNGLLEILQKCHIF